MPSCLGLYIENNIIKYAKISKEHDNVKVDSFGMKVYDNLDEIVKQIVTETYSFKTPISVNLSDEKYTSTELFSLLNKKDLEKAIATEFEYFCNENGKNKNALEYRRILTPNLDDRDKITSLYVYADKSSIIRKLQMLDGYRITNIVPLPMSITNLKTPSEKNDSIIINIEKNTSVTTIINGQINKIDIIENGMKEIFDNINAKENSLSKAYEICKNTTIYTTQGRNLQVEENEYMEDIMPVLYNIIENVKEIIRTNTGINTIYISGLAAVINNVDLYFQENFPDKKCEILTPFFINKTNLKLNIKDYIEVNSAISLALQGLEIGNKEIDFKNKNKFEKLSQSFTIDKGGLAKEKIKNENPGQNDFMNKVKGFFAASSGSALDKVEKGMIRCAVGIFILLIIYTVFSKILINQINNRETQIQAYITDTQGKIDEITQESKSVGERTEQYNTLIAKIKEANDKLNQKNAKKNAIPNFLTQIMTVIPQGVQLTSIKNTTGETIKIEAQAIEYEQLGYFIAKIKNEAILTDVTSTSGTKQNELIKVTIQGNLPFYSTAY